MPEAAEQTANKNFLRTNLCRLAIAVGGLALGAGLGAVIGAERPTQTTLAGNEATAKLQINNDVNDVDLGILGARIPSTGSVAGISISAKIRLDATQTYRPGKSSDETILPETLQNFSDIKHETSKVADDIKEHIIDDTIEGALVGLTLAGAGYLSWRGHKNARAKMSSSALQEQRTAYAPLWRAYKYVAVAGIVAAGVTAFKVSNEPPIAKSGGKVHPNSMLDGTSLEGSEITGAAAQMVDSGVIWVKKYITSTDSFYSHLDDRFKNSFEKYSKTEFLPAGPDIAPILLVSDRHCNGGMDRIIMSAAKSFDAKVIASGGDDYLWGSFDYESFLSESVCTSGLAERTRSGHIKFVAAIGNHDSHTQDNPAYRQGITVLDGPPKTVNTANREIRFLSIQDPRRSQFGQEIVPASDAEQAAAVIRQGKALGQMACDSQRPIDILVTHDARAATEAINSGCDNIGFAFSGHTHQRKLPQLVENGVYQYTEGSTGGAMSNTPSVGPLQSDADLSVLYFNTATHRPEGMVYITADSDGEIKLSPYMSLAR